VEEGITQLLDDVASGKPGAEERLYNIAYEQLRRQAYRHLRKMHAPVTLNPTSLLHEAWLKYHHSPSRATSSRHFYNILSTAMRQIVIDLARQKGAEKYGANMVREELSEDIEQHHAHSIEMLVAIDRALTDLKEHDPALAELIEWRYFLGIGVEEIARERGVDVRTVRRHWDLACVFLANAIGA
jgi:RNA polymerase sigma factor (TIGR02999 family)